MLLDRALEALDGDWSGVVGRRGDGRTEPAQGLFAPGLAREALREPLQAQAIGLLRDEPEGLREGCPRARDDDYPDDSFAWGSGLDPAKHGLEMQVRDVFSEKWADIRMDDLDGTSGRKLSTDINGPKDPDQKNPSCPGDFRNADDYVRTIDGVETDTVANGCFDCLKSGRLAR